MVDPNVGASRRWERINMGQVSAYVVANDGEATVIDTGLSGSADAIIATLGDVGLGWGSVSGAVLTHAHPDHAGSIEAVLDLASGATGYIGAADRGAVTAPVELVTVANGDSVMGLDVIETPGHTPGHISLLDPELSVLFAGDALNGSNGAVIGPNPSFSADMSSANSSVVTLAGLSFETVVFGHGEPVTGAASDEVGALVATQ